MTGWIWLFVAISAVEAVKITKRHLPRDELPIASPEVVEAFTGFLNKSLTSEGTYHRDMLVQIGVIPAPPNYTMTPYDGSENPDVPFTAETFEYFNRYITDIFSSLDKFDLAINKLFGKRVMPMYYQQIENTWRQTSVSESAEGTPPTAIVNPEVVSRRSRRGKSYEILCDLGRHSQSSYCRKEFAKTAAPTRLNPKTQTDQSQESSVEQSSDASVVDEITTEYIKYLTEMPIASTVLEETSGSGSSEASREKSNLTPLDDEYITFLLSGSLSPISSITEESNSIPLTRDSQSTLFLPQSTEKIYTSGPSDESDAIKVSPVTGRILTVEDVQLLDETVELTPEIKYYVISTSQSNFNKVSGVESENMETESTTAEIDYKTETSSKEGDKKRRRLEQTTPDTTEVYTTTETIPKSGAKIKRSKQMVPDTTDSEIHFPTETIPKEAKIRQPKDVHSDDDAPRMFLIRGTPGQDFPEYADIPNTNFTCKNKTHIPGFYADQEADCQVFHVCWPGRRESFLCPLGTIFDQFLLACDYWYNSNCSIAHAFHSANDVLHEAATETGTTGPMVDTLINAPNVRPQIISSIKDLAELYESDVHFAETLVNHDISKIWRFLPIQAKIYVEPQPELEEFLHGQNFPRTIGKRELDTNSDSKPAGHEDGKSDIKDQIESLIWRTVRKMSLSNKRL